MASDSSGTRVSAVDTAVAILDELREQQVAGVTQLAEGVTMSKANVHKHLTTLESHGFVKSNGGKYALGSRFFEFSAEIRRRDPLLREAGSVLFTLAETTRKTATLVVLENRTGRYVRCINSEDESTPCDLVGKRTILHRSAPGRAILAWSSESVREDRLSTSMKQGERNELLSALDRIEERGIAVYGSDLEHHYEIAVPIRIGDEEPSAAIGLLLSGDPGGDKLPNPNFVSQLKKVESIISKRIQLRHSQRSDGV